MAIPFYESIDLRRHEIRNMVVQRLTVFPVNPKEGQVIYHTVEKGFYGFTGTGWQLLAAEDVTYTGVGMVKINETREVDLTDETKAMIGKTFLVEKEW